MRLSLASVVLLAPALLACAPAMAGTAIDIDSTGNGPAKVLVSGDRARLESPEMVVLFNATRREATFVDSAAKQYTVLTQQEAGDLVRRLQQKRAQIEQQLQYLPEPQREQIRRRMDSMMPGLAEPSGIRLEPTGDSDQVAGTSCRRAKLYRDGQPTHRVCVTDPAALGIPQSDYATLAAMLDFAEAVAANADPQGGDLGAHAARRVMEQLGGMPVRAEGLGNNTARWAVSSVETRSIDDAEFAVPHDYQQREALGGLLQ